MPKPAKTDRRNASSSAGIRTVQVWDPFVRTLHWALALSFAVAWLSAESSARLHELAGYAAGALVLVRLAWGVFGPSYARFSQFVRSARTIAAYLESIAAGSERRFIGHNPAGGAMVVVLLASMTVTVATGWMLTTDAFWGSLAAQRAHSILAHGVLLLVFLHIGGVALASVRHNENLVQAMIFGDKRAPESGDVA